MSQEEVLQEMLVAIGGIIALIGGLASLIFSIQVLILNFQENVLWGLASLFFGIPFWIFVAMRWDKAGGPFLKSLAGTVVAFGGAFIAAMGSGG